MTNFLLRHAYARQRLQPWASQRQALAGLAILFALSGCQDEGRGLTVLAPARVMQAVTSTDAELCERLAVDFTMIEVGAAGPVIDREPLSPTEICEWSLANEDTLLPRGNYRMLVRLLGSGNYNGRASCQEAGADPLWVGAYWIDEVSFPFPADFGGFNEDSFLSTPADDATLITIQNRVGFSTASFDLDDDELDNLVEFAGRATPCVPNQPPEILLTATPIAGLEGEVMTLQVSTDEPGGLEHDVVVRFAHSFGAAYPPEQVEIVLRAYAPAMMTLPAALPGQGWNLQASVVDARPESSTAGSWEIQFLPDEPFVGPVLVTTFARQRGGGPSFNGAPPALTLAVENVPDPVRILLESDEGSLLEAVRLDFAEAGAEGSPTTLRLRAESQDIGAQVSGTLNVISVPDGVIVGEELGLTTLTWEPNNAAAVLSPLGGYTAEFLFAGDGGESFAIVLPIRVSPTFNDPPLFGDLATINGNLSPEPFTLKRFFFDVIDPDRVEGGIDLEPACTVAIWPEDDEDCTSACCDAFDSITCAPDGILDGDTWRMAVSLVPVADYFTRCGENPTFTARLTVTDRAPSNALPNETQTIVTVENCTGTVPCGEDVRLATADVTQALLVSGFAGNLTGDINATTGALIDGVTGRALLSVYLDIERTLVMLDLNEPPSVERIYLDTELGRLEDFLNYLPAGVVDEVNHRSVVYSRVDGVASLSVIEMEAPFSVQSWPLADICPGCTGSNCGSNPVVDEGGTVWVPCGRSGDGDLLRIDAQNQITRKDLAPEVDGASAVPGAAVLEDEAGREWLVWPDNLGLALIDLSTFDDVMPTILRASMPPEYNDSRQEGFGVSADRRSAYFAYNQFTGDAAEVTNVRFENGVPVVAAPIVIAQRSASNNGSSFHRLVFRQPAPAAPAAEADLLVTGGGDPADERAMIDLDSWTLLPFPRPAEDYGFNGIKEVYESPDPNYFAAVVSGNDIKGLVLFPWDTDQPPLVQNLDLPNAGNLRQTWVTVNHGINKMVINQLGAVVVVDYPGAP